MRINPSLRFLAIAGTFLTADAALAKNSVSTVREIVASNTFATQSLGLSTNDAPHRLSPTQLKVDGQINRDINDRLITKYQQQLRSTEQNLPIAIIPHSGQQSADQDSFPTHQIPRFGSDDDQGETPTGESRSSNRLIARQPAQINVFGHVFVSDLANINNRAQISSVPQADPEPTIPSVEIPVPFPRTQQIPGNPSSTKPVKLNTGSNSGLPTVQGSISTPISRPTVTPTIVPSNQTGNLSSAEPIYPLMTPAPITSRFGWRTHPITGIRRFHAGIDFGAPAGTPVVATISGTVISAGWNGGYGKAIVIQQNNQQVLYGHLSEISVQPGQSIAQGTAIGLVGSTGNSTGPHLHFESRVINAETWTAIDPSVEIHYALDNLRRSMPFAQRDSSPGL
jgi:murein DD-endopeptidase MepM/ murein hydrolase activator NlpD